MDLAPRNRFYAATARQFDLFYLISTFAPAASTFFLISSASCWLTPALIVLGAPSTSAFASARPSPGTALRTSLITAILFEPISVRITSNVVFSSAAEAAAPAAAPAAGAAATATGAAALTPHFSSSCLTNPAISRTERLLSCSTILSVSAILVFPPVAASESLRRIKVGRHRLGQFRLCWICATDKGLPDKIHAAGAPSFSAFALNSRANAAAG